MPWPWPSQTPRLSFASVIQGGTKGAMVTRLKLWTMAQELGLKTATGENPMLLKGAELKRQAVSMTCLERVNDLS